MAIPSAPPVGQPAAPAMDINVVAGDSCLIPDDNGKQRRHYTLVLMVDGVSVHTAVDRYSKFRHQLPLIGWFTPGDPLPFPPKYPMRDYTLNKKNVAKRHKELVSFFQTFLNQHNEWELLRSQDVMTALGIASDGTSDKAHRAFLSVASARQEVADRKRAMVAAHNARIAQQQSENCSHAQTFNQMVAYSDIPLGRFTTIAFPEVLRFELSNRWWSFGDANMKGPGGHPWFRMQRTNPALFGEMFKNASFNICTMRGEPLMLLQENFHWASYEYNLYRIDPRDPARPVHACKIFREWGANFLSYTDQYDIFLTQATQHEGRLYCSGRWPSQFTLRSGSDIRAKVNKEMFTFTDKYQVDIAAGADCLLFIGIACAIDRIHHEVESKKKR